MRRFGSDYGGYDVATDALNAQSVVYSCGVGEDVSFDLALIDGYHLAVHAFDPTPKSIEWVGAKALPRTFVFHPYGISDRDGTALFYPPDDPGHVSHTLLSHPSTSERAIRVPMKRIATVMAELGHDHIDILKLDIEGAEFGVIRDLIASRVRPRQLLVEFHHRFEGLGRKRLRETVRSLRRAGWAIFSVSESGEIFGFLRA